MRDKLSCITRMVLSLILFAFLGTSASLAQISWDPDNNLASDGGNGLWDTTTTNWEDGGANVVWSNGSSALFGDSGADYTVDIADGGVTVGDLTLSAGTGKLQLKSVTDNLGIVTIAAGGATWNTGGREIEFLNDLANDTPLMISSGDTLTIAGGGIFDTGEKPNGANWVAAGATLDFQGGTLRGNVASVGQFGQVNLADGSTYIHERNTDQTYGNNWDLTGNVKFDNRWARNIVLNGLVTGTGELEVGNMGGRIFRLSNAGNTFSGGLVIDSGTSRSELRVNAADVGALGTGDITLRNGGEIKLNGATINSSQDIVLDNGGIIVNTTSASTYGGKITGTGGLQIGRESGSDGNTLNLISNTSDYTGGTLIHQGSVTLGIDDALANTGVLTIGGKGTSQFIMDGFDQEVAGLQSTGSNTRRIVNNSATESNVTLNVSGTNVYGADVIGSGVVNFIKNGTGTQTFNRGSFSAALAGDVIVNDGELVWNINNDGKGGTADVGVNGMLSGNGHFDDVVTVAGTLSSGTTDTGATSVGTMSFNDTLTLGVDSNLILDFASLTDFDVLLNDGDNIFTAGGTLTLELEGYSPMVGESFVVFENWAGFSGSFAAINGTDLGGGLSFDTSTLLSNGTVTIITSVPEPGSIALVGFGCVLMSLRRRRA